MATSKLTTKTAKTATPAKTNRHKPADTKVVKPVARRTRTKTRTLRYSPDNFKQLARVWGNFAVDLILDLKDTTEPFEVHLKVRPMPKAKGGAK